MGKAVPYSEKELEAVACAFIEVTRMSVKSKVALNAEMAKAFVGQLRLAGASEKELVDGRKRVGEALWTRATTIRLTFQKAWQPAYNKAAPGGILPSGTAKAEAIIYVRAAVFRFEEDEKKKKKAAADANDKERSVGARVAVEVPVTDPAIPEGEKHPYLFFGTVAKKGSTIKACGLVWDVEEDYEEACGDLPTKVSRSILSAYLKLAVEKAEFDSVGNRRLLKSTAAKKAVALEADPVFDPKGEPHDLLSTWLKVGPFGDNQEFFCGPAMSGLPTDNDPST
jgi:hypothetical protein